MQVFSKNWQFFQKVLAAAGCSIFAWRIYKVIMNQQYLDPTLIILLAGEIFTVAIILLARPSKDYDMSLVSALSTVAASFYFLFISLNTGTEIINKKIAAVGQLFAVLWQIWAKAYLGRSFGLMPANRGIVTSGPYKIVRHPIYFGYFLNHLFFLLANFGIYNLAIYIALYFFQAVRIWREELLLKKDPVYADYMKKTVYRFVPGVF